MNRIQLPGVDYNTIELSDSADAATATSEQQIARKVGMALMKKYDQRQWKVTVNLETQMLIVGCDSICNYKGYHIHMMGRTIGELVEKALKGAGEILERHNLSRSRKFNPEILNELARDSRHSVIAPDAAAEPING